MGASSSTDQNTTSQSQEQHELESLAVSTGSLPLLQKVFSILSDPHTNSIPLQSLQECFHLIFETSSSSSSSADEKSQIPKSFPGLLSSLGSSIIDLFFVVDKDGINWIEFLRGYTKCCGRMSSSMALITLYRLYAATTAKAEFPSNLDFETEDPDTKISGYVIPTDVLMLLWMCWIMSQKSKTSKQEDLPDINHLVLSAITSSTDLGSDVNLWECSISDLEVQLPAQKFHLWALATTPNLAHCFTQYINHSLQRCLTSEDKSETSSGGDITSAGTHKTYLLTSGRAWSISLTLASSLCEEVLRVNAPRNDGKESENLLYRSSLHGKGMNRFWSSVEGYNGPLLVLISASSTESGEADPNIGRWIIGVLTQRGFENKDVFYGSSGNLYAISPIFHVFSPHGGEKNFVYSHLHATGKAYEPHPKPVGLAFGGTAGNERIFIDEDFTRITFRHHAVDKTYRPGSLFPNQGYLLVEASVFQVEIWGLGGHKVKEMQNSHMQREQLFTEQRRKVDLNSFGKWEDSPEKAMMSMVGDPNKPQREER